MEAALKMLQMKMDIQFEREFPNSHLNGTFSSWIIEQSVWH